MSLRVNDGVGEEAIHLVLDVLFRSWTNVNGALHGVGIAAATPFETSSFRLQVHLLGLFKDHCSAT